MTQSRIGPYEVDKTLTRGGSGTIYRCFRRDTRALAAVKIPNGSDARTRDALRREIAILLRTNRLALPGVVRILEHGLHDDAPWYAMELLEGSSLRSWRSRLWSEREPASEPDLPVTRTVDFSAASRSTERPALDARRHSGTLVRNAGSALPLVAAGHLERVLRVIWRLAKNLSDLHAENVIHGDLSPSNVVLRDDIAPVVIDFGAGLLGVGADSPLQPIMEPIRFCGTPGYTAPELTAGEVADARADLYGLGCILHELLAGVSAFSAERPEDILRQQRAYAGVSLGTWVEGCPADLDRLTQALLSPDPARRLVRAEDVCRVIGRHLADHPELPRPRGVALYRPSFQGRARLIEQLLDVVVARPSPEGGVVLVCGAKGSGKTRVLEELHRHAVRRGVVVCSCPGLRSQPPHGAEPIPNGALDLFAPLLEQLLALRTTIAEADRAALEDGLDRIARVSSAAAWRRGSSIPRAGGPALSDEAVLRHAQGALAEILPCLAHRAGLLVLVDDIDAADEPSLMFLREHAGALRRASIVVVATTASEGPKRPALGNVVEFTLPTLEASECRAIARGLLGAELLPEGMAEFLDEHAQHQPALVVEYTRAAAVSGVLDRSGAGDWRFDAANARTHIPSAFAAVYEAQIARLSAAGRDALRAACVFTSSFGVEAFRSVWATDDEPSEALEELVAHQVLRVVGPACYGFAEERLRATTEASLSAPESAGLHLRAAQHYEDLGDGAFDHRSATLGWHWVRAGDRSRAAGYFERGARAAETASAWARASELYRLALACTQARDEELRLLEALADVLLKQSRHRDARAFLERLANDETGDRLIRARARRKLAASAWTIHEYAEANHALARAEEAIGAVEDHTDPAAYYVEAIQIRLGRCQQLYFAQETGAELDALVRGLGPLVDRHGTRDQATSYYLTVASNVLLRGRYRFDEEALALARKGLEAATVLAAHRQAQAHLVVGGVLMLGGAPEVEESLAHFEEALRGAALDGEATLMARIRIFHAMALQRTGNVAETEASARLALEAAESARLAPYIAAARGCLGWAAWRRDDTSVAVPLLCDAAAAWKAQKHKFPFRYFVEFPLLELARIRDDHVEAAGILDSLRTGGLALPAAVDAAVDSALSEIAAVRPREADLALKRVMALARSHALA